MWSIITLKKSFVVCLKFRFYWASWRLLIKKESTLKMVKGGSEGLLKDHGQEAHNS